MIHEFTERRLWSGGVDVSDGLRRHLLELVPASTRLRDPSAEEDGHGTDLWVDRRDLPPLSVDFKHRSYCPIERWGIDDACIETCSVYKGPWPNDGSGKRVKCGWTIDATKRTDIVVYTWPAGFEDVRRFWILWFPALCSAAIRSMPEWQRRYRERPAQNNGYSTLNVYVPRVEIVNAMRPLLSGVAASHDEPVPF